MDGVRWLVGISDIDIVRTDSEVTYVISELFCPTWPYVGDLWVRSDSRFPFLEVCR